MNIKKKEYIYIHLFKPTAGTVTDSFRYGVNSVGREDKEKSKNL